MKITARYELWWRWGAVLLWSGMIGVQNALNLNRPHQRLTQKGRLRDGLFFLAARRPCCSWPLSGETRCRRGKTAELEGDLNGLGSEMLNLGRDVEKAAEKLCRLGRGRVGRREHGASGLC